MQRDLEVEQDSVIENLKKMLAPFQMRVEIQKHNKVISMMEKLAQHAISVVYLLFFITIFLFALFF